MNRRIEDIKGCHGYQQAQVLRQVMQDRTGSCATSSEIEQPQGDMASIRKPALSSITRAGHTR
jgi:hypothetical protein